VKSKVLASASAVAFFVLLGPALAQEPDPQPDADRGYETVLEEVIVTATRREERLQDVPLSVTAFSQGELTEKGIVDYQGLAHNTPGAVLNRASANFNNFSVRGIATNGYNANLASSVAIYIDELPISANGNSTILDPNLWDVERVEFLRGPQGTLFGTNSLAGAVRILTKNPDLNEFDSSVLVDYGLTDGDAFRQRYNAMVNIPLAEDQLALRLVGFYRDEEGWVDNIGTGIENANTLVDWGGRAILHWQPVERFYARLMYMREDSKPEDSFLIAPQLGDKVRLSDRPDRFQAFLDTYNLTLSYEFDGAVLTSSTTWTTFDQDFVVDLAATFAQALPFALDAFAYDDVFVEEVRLVSDTGGKFEWVLGGYYNDKTRTVDYNYRSTPEFLAARGITGLPDEYYNVFTASFPSHELAGFGSLSYYLKENLWVTGGLRYTDNDIQGLYYLTPNEFTSNYLTLALFGLSGPVTITPYTYTEGPKVEESGTSWKLSISHSPSENLTSYATISTGFRAPGANARAGQASALDPNDIIIPDGFTSDDLTNYEVGVKGAFLDHKLTAHVAAYYIDWEDIQVQVNRVSDSAQFATNIGAARSMGLEFEITASPTSGLLLGFNGSWNDSEVTDLTPSESAMSGAVEGVQLAFPELQGSAWLRYNFDFGSRDAFFTANAMYVDGYPNMFPYTPGRPGVPQPLYDETDSYTSVDLTLGTALGDKFMLTGYIENVFDDDSYIYVHPEAFIESRYGIQVPRTYGLRLQYFY
jgi:outer membrane receptor protein involved in Fe transport